MNTIKVFVKYPGRKPYITYINNTLECLQKYVEGHIEVLNIASNFAMVCNEEGAINGMHYNDNVFGHSVFGPILFVGIDGDDFANVPCDITVFKILFPDLFEGGNV